MARYPTMVLSNILYSLLLVGLIKSYTAAACTLPESWQGSWLLSMSKFSRQSSSVKTMITSNMYSERGICQVESTQQNYRYLFFKRRNIGTSEENACYACVQFFTRHYNVLEYKESLLCGIGDATSIFESACQSLQESQLFTLVRENAQPIPCPTIFTQDHNLTYSLLLRSYADCNENAELRTCASNTKAHLDFTECAADYYDEDGNLDAYYSDADMTCLAEWQNQGSKLYVKYNNDYRCMLIEEDHNSKITSIGMNVDGLCNGLTNINAAPVKLEFKLSVISVTTPPQQHVSCDYPNWLRDTIWNDLSNQHVYKFNSSQLIVERRSGYSLSLSQIHTCVQKISEHGNQVKFITEVTHECQRGYQCITVKSRSTDGNVIQIIAGRLSKEKVSACISRNTDPGSADQRLLISAEANSVKCPVQAEEVLSQVDGRCKISLQIGCDPTLMQFKECDITRGTYLCSHTWTDGVSEYLIVRQNSQLYKSMCFGIRRLGDIISLHIDEDECNYRSESIIPEFFSQPIYNLTKPGSCKKSSREARIISANGDGNSANKLTNQLSALLLTLLLLVGLL